MKTDNAIKLASLLGFGFVLLLLWLNELLDLPHLLLGAPATPVNYREALVETLGVVAVAAAVGAVAVRLQRQIRYLEGLTVICANCRKVRVHNRWTAIDEWLGSASNVVFSHSVCEHCLRELYPEQFPALSAKGLVADTAAPGSESDDQPPQTRGGSLQ